MSVEKSKVAIPLASPATAPEDYRSLLMRAGCHNALPKDRDIAPKVNTSRHFFCHGCSTTPWLLDENTIHLAGMPRHDFPRHPSHQNRVRQSFESIFGRFSKNRDAPPLPPDDLTTPGWSEVGAASPFVDEATRHERRRFFAKAMRSPTGSILEAPEFVFKRRHHNKPPQGP